MQIGVIDYFMIWFYNYFMKIMFVNNIINPSEGSGKYIINIVNNLIQKGHKVSVVASVFDNVELKNTQKIKFNNIFFFNFKNYYRKFNIYLRILYIAFEFINLYAFIRFIFLLKNIKPDVVHFNNTRGLSYLLFLSCKLMKTKSILTVHDIQYIYPMGILIKNKENLFYNRFFVQNLYAKFCSFLLRPDIVIFPSNWISELYEKNGFFKHAEKYVKYNFSPDIKESAQKIDYKKDGSGKINLLYVGKIEEYKGVEFFIDCMHKHKTKFKFDVRLKIAGNGSLYTRLNNKYKEDGIEFMGNLDTRSLQNAYQWADYLVVPSLTYENMPLVILESFCFKTPVIASDIGGISDIVDKNSGFLFAAGDCQSFLNTLIKAYETLNSDKYPDIQKHILNKTKDMTVDNYTDFLLSLYS